MTGVPALSVQKKGKAMQEVACNRERSYPRFCAPLTVLEKNGPKKEPFTTRNVSVGGLFLVGGRRPEVGSILNLELQYAGVLLPFRARVTHLQADGFGVAFVYAEEAFVAKIRKIIDDLLAAGAPVDERRVAARKAVRTQVVWSHEGRRHDGLLRNISYTGAFVESSQAPVKGTEVALYLPGYCLSGKDLDVPSEARGCVARVAHCKPDGFGLELVSPSAEFRMAIDRLLAGA